MWAAPSRARPGVVRRARSPRGVREPHAPHGLAGAVESGRGKTRGRRLGRLRLAVVEDASANSLEGFLGQNVAKPTTVATDGWSGYRGLDAAGYTPSRTI